MEESSSAKVRSLGSVYNIGDNKGEYTRNPLAQTAPKRRVTMADMKKTAVPKSIKTRMKHSRAEALGEIEDFGAVVENTIAETSMLDHLGYVVENEISSDAMFPFILLAIIFSIIMFILTLFWYGAASGVEDVYGDGSFSDSMFVILQLLTAAGFDELPENNGLRWWYFISIFLGLIVFAALLGFINDSIQSFMTALSEGRTKVIEDDHTLILGWNEATVRVVVQTSFLRRQYQTLNETAHPELSWFKMLPLFQLYNYLGWLERPSTSLAANDIVIMTDTMSKEEMHTQLEHGLAERGIDPSRTQLGKNIICRVGDPTNVNDLIRVRAHKAAAIVVMQSVKDREEEDASDMKIVNGATIRTALALRNTVFSNAFDDDNRFNPDLRMVLQLDKPSNIIDAAAFHHYNGSQVMHPLDLSAFLNGLMFKCAAQPGLAKVIMDLLDFEGTSIRRRKAKNLRCGSENEYGACIGMTFKQMRKQFTVAIFIGIIRPGITDPDEIRDEGLGMCPNPDTIIQEDDLLIFIGPRSNPINDATMVNRMDEFAETAKRFAATVAEQNDDRNSVIGGGNTKGHNEGDNEGGEIKRKNLANLLVCGWRPVWAADPSRLKARVFEVATKRQPGSKIIFVNGLPFDEFDYLAEVMGAKKIRDGHDADIKKGEFTVSSIYELQGGEVQGIIIEHYHGDAAQSAVMESIVLNETIHTCIVMGTQADVRLQTRFQDTRVLNIMLMLRKLWNVKAEGVPMHVVGENQADMTARLALSPRAATQKTMADIEADMSRRKSRKKSIFGQLGNLGTNLINTINVFGSGKKKKDHREPDFINTQAIYARVLAQTLAYPIIRPAVQDMFDESDGSSNIEIVRASAYLPLNTELEYGVVRAAVLQAQGERSICLGYMDEVGQLELVPSIDSKITFSEDCSLVLLRRLPLYDGLFADDPVPDNK